MSDKIYCGSAKEKTFQDGGSIIEVNLTLDGMNDLFKQYGFTTDKGKKIIKLKIGKRREVGQYGETHTVEINTWKPDPQGDKPAPQTNSTPKPAIEDDIPF